MLSVAPSSVWPTGPLPDARVSSPLSGHLVARICSDGNAGNVGTMWHLVAGLVETSAVLDD